MRPAGTPNSIARDMGVPPSNFTKHGVDDDPPGVTYWKAGAWHPLHRHAGL
jgi:hypothetical protein